MSLLQEQSKRKSPTTFSLAKSPSENLSALKSSVANYPEMAITSEGDDTQLNFVILEYVLYPAFGDGRELPVYKVSGSFQADGQGKTTLHYKVSGHPRLPIIGTSMVAGFLVLLALVGSFSKLRKFPPEMLVPGFLGLAVLVILLSCVNYFGHMRDLDEFMKSFVERMEWQAKRKLILR